MELLEKIEERMASWYVEAPRLNQRQHAWMVQNVWWIALVGAVIFGLGALWIILGAVFASTLLTLFGGIIGLAISGILAVAVIYNTGFSLAIIILVAFALRPLRQRRREGWWYLFVSFLVAVAYVIVVFLLHFNAHGLVMFFADVVGLGIWGYFLFEIRNDFIRHASTHSPQS